MPLTTIISAKELSQSYLPLFLAEITFTDGTVLRMSTHDFRTTTTGIQYGGHDYLPQILNQDLAAVQALSADGIDAVPTVTLKLADADRFLWLNFEQSKGFKGAELILRFVFFDLVAKVFSSDYAIKFVGICDPPNMEEDTMSIRAVSKMNMVRQNLPTTRIQTRDPHPFPNTKADRIAALIDPSSPFYKCGYSADVTDIDVASVDPSNPLAGTSGTVVGFGNLNGGVAYTSADYDGSYATYLTVLGHGSDSLHDTSSRSTGTFAGIRWVPPNTFNSKSYATGKTVHGYNTTNQNLYSDFIPMVYGTGLVDLPVVSILGDGNSTRGEAVVASGKISNIVNSQLIVNNVNVTAATDMDGNAIAVNDPLIRYNVINRGNRNSIRVNQDALFDGKGDCYGSICALEWCIYNQVAASSSVPSIQAVVDGAYVRQYSDPTTYTYVQTPNPAWIMLDLLVQSSAWTYADVDIQTFIDASQVCARLINYTDIDGSTKQHPLFNTSLVMRQRKSAAEWIKALRTSFRAILVPNSQNNGLLQLFIEQTLADQQPSPITGSNYNDAIASIDHTGTAANGYVAYDFSDTNGTILRNGKKSTLKISQTAISSTPNALSFTFQDGQNNWQQDSVTIVSAEDISRVTQEVTTNFTVAGISSFDQAQRIGAWWIAKSLKGNLRGDTGGTLHFSWSTNFKALHLQVGQIVRLSSAHDNISNQLVRLTSVKPSANFETVELEGDWHDDNWYQDYFGTLGFTAVTNPARGKLTRPPYPWLPNELAPANTNDPLFSQSTYTFDVAQAYPLDAAKHVISTLSIIGKQPINTFIPGQPFVRAAFNVDPTGGTLPCGKMYSLCLCATDGFSYSLPSYTVNVPIPAGGTNTNSITLTDVTFSGGTAWTLFAGVDQNKMCFQTTSSSQFDTPVLTTLLDQTWGVPDIDFDSLEAKLKHVEHSGVLGDPLKAVTSSTLQATDGGWTADQWVGRVASILGSASNMNELKVLNYTITANSGDTLTVGGNPMTDGVGVGDALVIRTLADTFSANTIGDSKFINSYAPSGLTGNAEVGNLVRIIAGTGANTSLKTIQSNTNTVLTIEGTFDVTPDATSIFIVEDSTWLSSFQTDSINNSDPTSDIQIDLRIDNLLGETLLVDISTFDGNDQQSLETKNVYREVYVFGHPQPTAQPQATFIFGRNLQGGPADIILNSTSNLVVMKNPGVLTGWDAIAITPPTGQDAKFDIFRTPAGGDPTTDSVSIFGTPVTITMGATTLCTGSTFSGTISITPGDIMQAKVIQNGTMDSAQSVTINLYAQLPT